MSEQPRSSEAPEPAIAWGALASCILPPIVGVFLAVVLLLKIVLPTVGYGIGDRMIAVSERLDQGFEGPSIVFLGSSVVEEGIDAGVVESAAPGWSAFNFSISGCEINEQRVMLPKVLASEPTAVVLLIRPITLARPGDIPVDKAYGYALGDFPAAWPAAYESPDVAPLMSGETLEILQVDELEAKLHFRRAPILAMNDRIRQRIRRGVRAVAPTDFISPHQLTAPITGRVLDNHVNVIIDENTRRMESLPQPVGRELRLAVEQIAAAGATPVLVTAPQHPRVAPVLEAYMAELVPLAQSLADGHGGVFLDATELVGADGFADALHLGESGRAALSELIGAEIGARLEP